MLKEKLAKEMGNKLATTQKQLRARILKRRAVELEKGTKRPLTYDELPSSFPKSRLMKYIELKFSDRLGNLIAPGTIYEIAKRLGIDASTVSKWRKILAETKEKEFWNQFKERR